MASEQLHNYNLDVEHHIEGDDLATHTEHAADAHHDAHAGPIYLDPTFWVLIATIVFAIVVFKPLAKAIVTALDNKAEKIKEQLEEATRLKEEAQASLAMYKRKQKEAAEEAQRLIDNARQQVDELQKQTELDLKELLARKEQQALDRIEQAETQAMSEVRNLAVDIAMTTTRQLLAEKMTDTEADAIIQKAVQNISSDIH